MRKSISHWWEAFTENYGRLWRSNLLYLLCIGSSAICGFLFLSFRAYLFFALAAVLLIPAGPAALALHEIAYHAAVGQPKQMCKPFFILYRDKAKQGLLLGAAMAALVSTIALPPCFAYAIQSRFLLPVIFAACLSLLLCCSGSAQVLRHLCENNGINCSTLLYDIFSCGTRGVLCGMLKLCWLLACLLFPIPAIAGALVGVPALLRFSTLYLLYAQDPAAP